MGSVPVGMMSKHFLVRQPQLGLYYSIVFSKAPRFLEPTHSDNWDTNAFEYIKRKDVICAKSSKGLWHKIKQWLFK